MRSDIKRKISDGFDVDMAIKYFGIPEIEHMGDVILIPRGGGLCANVVKVGKDNATFNVLFTFDMRQEKKFLLLDTEKSPFFHPPTGTMIDGRVSVDSDEKDNGIPQTLALTTIGIVGVKDVW